MNMQEHLLYITERTLRRLEFSNLRGVTALWRENDHTACLTFYFNAPITDEDVEETDDLAGGIIAHFYDGLLEENHIRWDYPLPLPPNKFLIFLANKI